MHNGVDVGFASAAAYSPRLEWNIATALIAVEAADADGGLVVLSDDGERHARPTSLPFRNET
jgi:glycine cleavage system aminomethyltransferase T